MIEKRAENIMIPEEANYQRTMKRDVEPYLRSYEKDGYIESYDKTAIYYRSIPISHGFCSTPRPSITFSVSGNSRQRF